jgi:Tol biopolymer transport system component/DNA-binding winged helix-turn-helix (wHTH) protein
VSDPVFQFEEFELHCGRFQLLRKGRPLRVEPKPLELLILLVSQKGHLVSRREIVERLWQSDVFVDTDHSINTAIRKLRHLLRDDSETPKYIETVTGMGYRFVAPVLDKPDANRGAIEKESEAGPEANEQPSAAPREVQASPIEPLSVYEPGRVSAPSLAIKSHLRLYIGITTAILLLALGSGAWYFVRPLPSLRIATYTPITHDGGHKMPVGTDGTRLYFSRDVGDPIGEVSVAGGEARSIHVDLPQAGLGLVWNDGYALLVGSLTGNEFTLWKLQVPSGALKRLLPDNELLKETQGVAASPNGQSIVLVTVKGDLIMMDGDGAHVHRFLSPPKEMSEPDAEDPTWSPDGKKLRFTWNHRFWEVASDGSGLHPVLPNWRPGTWECCGRWTSDGSSFVFTAPDNKSTNMPLSNGQLWALDERSTVFKKREANPVQLTNEPMRWISPVADKQAESLFAEGVVFRGELVRYASGTSELRPFLHGISAEYLEYSPDGNAIVYVTFPEGILWRVNRDGTNPVQLTSPPIYPINPHWSPDGSRILYYTMGYGEQRRAYTVPAQGGESVQISSVNHPTDILDPTWSPDGRNIAYATAGHENSPIDNVEILDLATHLAKEVKGSEGMWSPRWSPDGRYIVALDPTSSVVVFDFESEKWNTLAKGLCGYPTWSRDSRSIYYFRSTQPEIFRVHVNGGEPEKAFDLPSLSYTGALGRWFGIDPDAMPIMLRDAGSDEIYLLTLSKE